MISYEGGDLGAVLDTIAALATPPLSGAVAVVRVSGAKAVRAVEALFFPAGGGAFSKQRDREMIYGSVKTDGAVIDRALAVKMLSPHSYTGEDMCELHLHGSIPVVRAVLEALSRQGVRQAGAGEFTKRAFLHGKMNLSQAEAVIDLIEAETRDAARNAAGQLGGGVGARFAGIYNAIADLLAHFGVLIDYPDESIPGQSREGVIKTLEGAASELAGLLESFAWGRTLKEGVRVSILGKPNVGKSSVLNALLGCERAIVSGQAGTTRDTIEESVSLGGVMLRLTDGAGIRPTDDQIESAGVRRAIDAAKAAELIFVVLDGSQPMDGLDRAVLDYIRDDRGIVLVNKSDLPLMIDTQALEAAFLHVCHVSALTGQGLGQLDAIIRRMYETLPVYDGSVISNTRQAEAISRTYEAVRAALEALRLGVTPDAVMGELESALAALGELTGRHISEDILDKIFEKFCVGK